MTHGGDRDELSPGSREGFASSLRFLGRDGWRALLPGPGWSRRPRQGPQGSRAQMVHWQRPWLKGSTGRSPRCHRSLLNSLQWEPRKRHKIPQARLGWGQPLCPGNQVPGTEDRDWVGTMGTAPAEGSRLRERGAGLGRTRPLCQRAPSTEHRAPSTAGVSATRGAHVGKHRCDPCPPAGETPRDPSWLTAPPVAPS